MKNLFWVLLIGLMLACTREEPRRMVEDVEISLGVPGLSTRSADPDETLVTDFNLFVFNQLGFLEARFYVSPREMSAGSLSCTARLCLDVPYIILAAANLGYELSFDTFQEAVACRYHMAYPDEFSCGIPMSSYMPTAIAGPSACIDVPLRRLMARADLSIDRRSLNADVNFRVTSVHVCSSASSVLLFAESTVEYWSQIFTEGYSKSGSQIYWLNHDTASGVSGEVPFYLLENLSGGISPSYLEVHADYHSSSCHTRPGSSLIYRFYITSSQEVQRNSRYHILLRLSGDGLSAPDSWSLDTSALVYD